MKTIIVDNYSGIVDAYDWIKNNQADAMNVKDGVCIDLSVVEYVYSSIVGLVIYLLVYYRKHNIHYEIIRPENKLMLSVFNDILEHFNV